MRLSCLVLLLAVIPAYAQETPLSKNISGKEAAIALPLLRSTDTCTRAWGAYLVGKYDLKENAKDLVAELERLQPFEDTGDFADYRTTWYVQTLLDALIQLRHPVEPSVLMPFRRRWGPEVLILLLTRDAEANQDTWFSLLAEDLPCEQWLAVSNFLAGMKAPGFAAKLLSAVQFHMTVVVTENGSGIGGGVGGGSDGGLPYAPAGCPPAATYRLSLTAWPEYVMLAPGPTPVYYWRSETPAPS